jgi:hypothetical protein
MQSKSLFHPGLLKVEDTFVEKTIRNLLVHQVICWNLETRQQNEMMMHTQLKAEQ